MSIASAKPIVRQVAFGWVVTPPALVPHCSGPNVSLAGTKCNLRQVTSGTQPGPRHPPLAEGPDEPPRPALGGRGALNKKTSWEPRFRCSIRPPGPQRFGGWGNRFHLLGGEPCSDEQIVACHTLGCRPDGNAYRPSAKEDPANDQLTSFPYPLPDPAETMWHRSLSPHPAIAARPRCPRRRSGPC